jgi:hypothetical protein
MKKMQQRVKKFTHYFLTFKFPLKIIALIVIVFLGLITLFITYKASIEVWDFINFKFISQDFKKSTSIFIAVIISVSTLIQSSPIIWQRLEFWGQHLDNFLIYLITRKKYFLDVVDNELKQAQDQINHCHFKLQEYNWNVSFSSINKNKITAELDELLNKEINRIRNSCVKSRAILQKCEPTDITNIQRKLFLENNLNMLIVHTTELAISVAKLRSNIMNNSINT